jgi:regulatory protein
VTHDKSEPPGLDEEALARALRFIDYRPRSRGETTDRLVRWGYSLATADDVAEYLERCGIIDDREFAGVFLDEMLRKGYGYYRVRRALIEKRLDRSLVDEVLNGYPIEEELARAAKMAQTHAPRFSQVEPYSLNRRLADYLMRRGYSRQIAMEACRLVGDVDTQNWRE